MIKVKYFYTVVEKGSVFIFILSVDKKFWPFIKTILQLATAFV